LPRIPTLSIAVLPATEAHQLWLLLNGSPISGLTQSFAPAALRTIHTAEDVLEKVSGASMARMHQFALALVRRLSASQP
jgi:hypothetical protein